ncbi:PadR family transcriptional regulator [Amphibacillus jilinensis]|uniref:PadR family transcriptional regulator n=1 Tax=Amphibacillus jilinensis TaxID=1216008 RepID=UPI0002EC53E4|nr:PadR family transcriptional regulator [Amphibacillus jilinensis]
MTRLLVLAMLELQPMSGYDIKQMLKLNDAERWAGVLIGSIYNALKKLEKEDYIKVKQIEQTGHRQKAIYHITEKGKQHSKALIYNALQDSSMAYPTTLYAGLSFAHKIQAKDVKSALIEQKQALGFEYDSLKKGLEAKKAAMQNAIPPMTQLIFEHMFAAISLQQDFVEKALILIEDSQ